LLDQHRNLLSATLYQWMELDIAAIAKVQKPVGRDSSIFWTIFSGMGVEKRNRRMTLNSQVMMLNHHNTTQSASKRRRAGADRK